jgi:hypothetical protein
METGTVLDKRTCRDRRMGGVTTHTGPERRELRDRRSGLITVCIFCGDVCGDQKGWIRSPLPMETAGDFIVDVCADCHSKRFTKFYSKTQSLQ